jgi:hypothetical protein
MFRVLAMVLMALSCSAASADCTAARHFDELNAFVQRLDYGAGVLTRVTAMRTGKLIHAIDAERAKSAARYYQIDTFHAAYSALTRHTYQMVSPDIPTDRTQIKAIYDRAQVHFAALCAKSNIAFSEVPTVPIKPRLAAPTTPEEIIARAAQIMQERRAPHRANAEHGLKILQLIPAIMVAWASVLGGVKFLIAWAKALLINRAHCFAPATLRLGPVRIPGHIRILQTNGLQFTPSSKDHARRLKTVFDRQIETPPAMIETSQIRLPVDLNGIKDTLVKMSFQKVQSRHVAAHILGASMTAPITAPLPAQKAARKRQSSGYLWQWSQA